jgi:RNA polymerase sigma-70 factor (sigma-E family)
VEDGVSIPEATMSESHAHEVTADVPASGPPEALRDYAGDFEAWVRAESGALRRSAFLLTGDEQLAEDLVQTALTKVARRWNEIVAVGDPMPYVRQVITRTAIGWHRRKWRGEVPDGAVPEVATSDAIGPAVAREHLRVALLGLPARQRAVIVLRYYEDLTEAQTATLLGCSVGTVKSQCAKALAKLRGVVDVAPDEEDD